MTTLYITYLIVLSSAGRDTLQSYESHMIDQPTEVSMNDSGPNFIPKLFDILIRIRSYYIALVADIKKAFLMVSIKNSDCDVVRYLWLEDPCKPDSSIIHLCFARSFFGLRPSPAILSSVITHHLSQHQSGQPQLIQQIKKCLYVDDLITGTMMLRKHLNCIKTWSE